MNNCPTCKGIKMSMSFIDADLRKAIYRGNRGDDVSEAINMGAGGGDECHNSGFVFRVALADDA